MVWSQDFLNKFHKNYSFVLAGATWLEVKYMILEDFGSFVRCIGINPVKRHLSTKQAHF